MTTKIKKKIKKRRKRKKEKETNNNNNKKKTKNRDKIKITLFNRKVSPVTFLFNSLPNPCSARPSRVNFILPVYAAMDPWVHHTLPSSSTANIRGFSKEKAPRPG